MRFLLGGLALLFAVVLFAGGSSVQYATETADANDACAPPDLAVATDPSQVPATAQPADADVIAAFRRALAHEHPLPVEQLALWEAGLVESGLHNLTYGDSDSLGALQERVSIYGRNHALDPFASAVRFLRDTRALRPWHGTAGILAADVQRPRRDLRGRYDEEETKARTYLTGGGDATTVPAGQCETSDLSGITSDQLAGLLVTADQGASHGIVLNPYQRADLLSGGFDPRLMKIMVWIGQRHRVVVTALRHDHRPGTNHEAGRAVDIGMVDGFRCFNYTPRDSCGQLAVSLTHLGTDTPNELIACFDPDHNPATDNGNGGNATIWAQADHCDHVHVGYNAPVAH